MARKSMNEIYRDLLSRVYEDDIDSQRYYFSVVETERNISTDYLLERGCLFVPNNDYIKHYIGDDANTWGCDLYIEDICMWTAFFLIPILDLSKDVVGLVGWDFQNKFLERTGQAEGLPTYRVSSKNVFAREKYFLADIELMQREFDSRTLFITDGVFDAMALNYRGVPAMALLGSTFSREIIYLLQWYKRIYVCADNDSAGGWLYRKLKGTVPGVYRVFQSKTKDIEELLRPEDLDGKFTRMLQDAVHSGIKEDIWLK